MEAVMSSTELSIQTDQDPPNNNNGSCVVSSSSSTSAVFRKIEFHPARKPFNGFSNGGSNFKIETLNPSSSGDKRRFSSPSGKKSDSSDLLEHGLDLELSCSITFRKIGAGLKNLGNTCFLNSVLQCLTYTEPFAAYLHKAAHQQRCRVAGFCALCAMQKHVRTARQATGRIVVPNDLVSNLRCVSRNFRTSRQEDAHEYMINLLECMHKCCLPSGVPSESSDAYKTSLVHKIFGGSLRSQVKCEQCSHCSNKFDPFLDLSLDISRADSLQKALLRFTAVELLDDGRKVYQCERCKHKVKARKQLTVSKAPYVLTVHLKRFEAHRSEKIDRKVQFTPTIDMKPFVSGPNEGTLKYTLYGVLVHYGRSTHSGHYACFVRTSSGMWYSLDDNRVFQVNERTVFDQKAYMLFYVRDRQNVSLKNAVTVVQKEIPKESLATNRASLVISSNLKDQVNGSTDIKACGLSARVPTGSASGPLKSCDLGAAAVSQKDSNAKETQKILPHNVEAKEILEKESGSASAPLRSCDLGTPAVVIQKGLDAKETLKNPLSSVEAKEILKREEGSASAPLKSCDIGASAAVAHKDSNAKETLESLPNSVETKEVLKGADGSESLKSCELDAPAALSRKDLNTKETLSKEVPLTPANGETLVKNDAKAACKTLPGKASPLLDGSSNTQIHVNLPTSGSKGESRLDEKNTNEPTNEPNSVKVVNVSSGNSSIKEAVVIDQTLGQQAKESTASTESLKAASNKETPTTPRKARTHTMKALQVGLKFFKMNLSLRKKKKHKRRIASTSAGKIISEGLVSKEEATGQENSTSQAASEVASSSSSLHGKDNNVRIQSKKKSCSNGNTLVSSPSKELKQRINQNGTILASNQQKSSDLKVAGENAKRKRESTEEESVILTRGLPETIVAKWDEDVPTYGRMGSNNEVKSIGYVADEWDEEYDRGKKKKIRVKEEKFGGPNPFQAIASQRIAEKEKKWTQRVNTAKTAFRI